MNQNLHCNLCKFPLRSLKNGLTCGLTKKKPIFKNTCSKIKFSDSFYSYLPELLDQIDHLRKQKTSVYINFTLFSVVGLIILILTSRYSFKKIFEFDFSYSSYLYLSRTLLLFFVGIGLITLAYRRVNNHLNLLKKLLNKKKEIDDVLTKYNLDISKLIKS